MEDVLVSAEYVSKKFCRSLKRSLWYGVQDIGHALNPFARPDAAGKSNHAEDVPLRADEFWAIRDISFEVRRGQCIGLIGHNGAGKSTLLKVLNGLIRPDTGRVTMRGRVGALIELNAGFNPILSGRENIYHQASLLGFTKEETEAKFDDIVAFS
ncbi:MAG: ATP-binding cassette domain-containing protein [Gemmatimonadales bacterium]